MADLRPFRALRPRVDLAARVAAPPYDVVDTAEARALVAGNPDSFLHINRPEINLPDGVPTDSEQVHAAGRTALNNFVARGVLTLDPTESYSVYQQIRGDQVQTGLVGCAAVSDYTSGVIKTHEQTRPDKENDRVNHIVGLSAHDEPVFLLAAPGESAFKPVVEICAAITERPPLVELTDDDGVTHVLWRVDEPVEVGELNSVLRGVPELFVADGHHRSAAAARVAQAHPDGTCDAFPVVVFPGEELAILAYNRVIADLGGASPQDFVNALSTVFEIENSAEPVEPAQAGEFGLYLAGTWLRLRLRGLDASRAGDPVARLDVSLLQDLVLAPTLGIADPRTDGRISFVGGIRGTAELARLVDSGRWAAAFSMHPTSVADLVGVAASGRDMPPKSTWFEPKLRSGLFVHRFQL